MKNYLDYFISKYLNTPGPLPEIEERNGIYYINGQVVGEKPLSAKDPLLSLWVEGAVLGKPLEWAGRGLWAGAKFVAPKTTANITKGINYLKHYIKPKRHKAIIGSGESTAVSASTTENALPEGITPNYLGDHLALAKERLANGGYERIGNPSLSKQELLARLPEEKQMLPGDPHNFWSAETGIGYMKPRPYSVGKNADPASQLTEIIDRNAYNLFAKNNQALAHEFEHFVHLPKDPLTLDIIDFRYISDPGIRQYFTENSATEVAARFSQLKNYFGLKEGLIITPEMWQYARTHYIKDTGLNNNMTEFFNLPIQDLLKFLNWGNKNALSIAAPVSVGTTIMKNENN